MQQAYIDESGYTGRDLLNAQQPFMVHSALFIAEDEATGLRSKYFPRLQATELKHQSLARRPSNWNALLGLQRECLEHFRGITYVADKRYICILKLLDDCIEPVCHQNGIDFYQNGHNYALASLLYVTGPTFFGREHFDTLLQLYQNASATKHADDINALCEHANALRDRELGDVLSPISNRHPAFVSEISDRDSTTNVAFSLLSGLLSQLELRSGGVYSITHDPSPAMREHHELLAMLMRSEPASFQISDVAKFSYPLKLRKIVEADSKASVGLQLADVLAGAVAEGAKSLTRQTETNDYNTKVIDLYSDDNLIFLFPNRDQRQIQESFEYTEAGEMIDFIARSAARRN